jgi:hypothetical protein
MIFSPCVAVKGFLDARLVVINSVRQPSVGSRRKGAIAVKIDLHTSPIPPLVSHSDSKNYKNDPKRTASLALQAMARLLGAWLVSVGVASANETWNNYTVSIVQSPNYNANCLFFQLTGVTQADPVNPNSPWFAILPTQNGYSEIAAMLIAAHVSGINVEVVTTGAAAGGACGSYAGVAFINLQ